MLKSDITRDADFMGKKVSPFPPDIPLTTKQSSLRSQVVFWRAEMPSTHNEHSEQQKNPSRLTKLHHYPENMREVKIQGQQFLFCVSQQFKSLRYKHGVENAPNENPATTDIQPP